MRDCSTHHVRLRPLSLLALVGAALAFPAVAHASDSKILPATVCQVYIPFDNLSSSAITELRNSIRYGANGRVVNWSTTQALTVVCPIVRDVVGSTLDWLNVYFTDSYPGAGANGIGNVKCRLRSNNPQGLSDVAEHYDSSDQTDGADGDFFMTLDAAVNDGNYTLACTLPPAHPTGGLSSIGSIRYQEP